MLLAEGGEGAHNFGRSEHSNLMVYRGELPSRSAGGSVSSSSGGGGSSGNSSSSGGAGRRRGGGPLAADRLVRAQL